MTQEDSENLDRGDIVRHVSEDASVLVDSNYGKRVTAVRTFDLTNPTEWVLVAKANYKK